jgi:hypothetical protein
MAGTEERVGLSLRADGAATAAQAEVVAVLREVALQHRLVGPI